VSLGQLPSWYCPPRVELPAYVHWRVPTQSLVPGMGPDVDHTPDAPGGGVIYGGGGWTRGQAGWKRTTAGHWVRFAGAQPQYLVRMDLHSRIVTWRPTEGTLAGQEWLVPQLVKPVFRKGSDDPRAYVSALEQTWGAKGWQTPEDLVPLQERLVTVAQGLALPSPGYRPMMQLVVDILKMGHHSLDFPELEANGWLTQRLVLRVFVAACGLEIENV
jgi:hypothetical protein